MVRSNAGPAGSTCSTTPEASSGAVRRASWALETTLRPSKTVTTPRPTTLQDLVAVLVVIDGAGVLVDADAEQLGLCATSISSRP